MRPLLLFLFVFLTATTGFAQHIDDGEAPPPAPGFLDALLPGYWQLQHGDPVVGVLGLGGFASSFAPLFVPAGSQGKVESWVEKNGQHYVQWNEPTGQDFQDLRLVRGAAITSGIWGGFFSVYATWDMYSQTKGRDRWAGRSGLGTEDFLFAPFQAEQVFNFDVFPVFPLLDLMPLGLEHYKAMGAYFARDRVNFLGASVSPWAGLGLTLGSSMVLVMANAALEEIAFRGLALDSMGVVASSVYFGLNHLVNAFVLPNFSLEDAGMQSSFAFLFGLYTASRTEANGGDFRRMIALHYWHNVTAFVVSYMVDPDHAQLFEITLKV